MKLGGERDGGGVEEGEEERGRKGSVDGGGDSVRVREGFGEGGEVKEGGEGCGCGEEA